jgi:crotonobetainyl-CoA:carnitine CoA-transferase CaiB-like acyl-CoA transferase
MLAGLRVLDLSDASGLLAGRILAELGADVVQLEPPGGHPERMRGPRLPGGGGAEAGVRWLALCASKRSAELDLESEAGRETLRRLCMRADVLLECFPPGWLAERGLGVDLLQRAAPRLVHCSITPFGSDGPRAHYRASDLVTVAMGGNAALTGDPDRPPLRCTAPTSHLHAAPEAALAIVMALHARERTGRGQHVDLSLQECQLATLVTSPGQVERSGQRSRGGARLGRTREIWPTKDGHVSFGLRGGPSRIPNLIATVELMEELGLAPEWLRAVDWSAYNHNTLPVHEIERLEEAFGAFFRTRTMRELYEAALARRILLAPCNDSREVLEHPQLRARDLFARVDIPDGGSMELPSAFARSSSQRVGVRGPAPRLGEHTEEVMRWLEDAPPPESAASDPDPAGVFAGLRVLEFGSGAAGPIVSRYFAEQGARVVRVESRKRPDFLRLLHLTPDDPDSLDAAPMFALLNPDKESVSLDLSRPEGAALARRLVAWADVVVENFAPGVMAKFGLDAASVRAERPELVVVSSCLFGQTGPQKGYPGFGGQGAAIAGFNHLTGWPDREAIGPYGTITDTLSPRYVALLVVAALLERGRSGRGQSLDVSQIETGVYSLSESIARASATGEVAGRLGNHDEEAAPHAIYPCRGEDRWIAIAVLDDREWGALVSAMGAPDWASDARYDVADGRLRHQHDLDRRLGEWTSGRDAFELMEELQSAGVRAGVVQTLGDLLSDPQLAHRGHFRRLVHPVLGELAYEHSGFRLSSSPPHLERPGPLLGEHNEAVLQGVLGLDDEELRRLVASGAVA